MKNYQKITTVVALMFIAAACSVKSTSSKTSTTSNTSASTSSSSSSSSGTTTNVVENGTTDCPVVVEGKCYRKVSGIVASGGTAGLTWWSSTSYTASGTGRSPNLFSTDGVFKVRVVARSPSNSSGGTSTFGRKCSPYMLNSTKLKINLMLHMSGVSVGDTASLESAIDVASPIYSFTPPATGTPLVLEVVNVQSDSACSGKYGSVPSGCTYLPIPVQSNTSYPTECVDFDILYSTDDVWSASPS
jgi:hypothetical protein